MNITYCPGHALFVTGESEGRRFAVLLDASAADLVDALWLRAEQPFEPIELIDVLASRGLAHLPDFAYVVGDAEQVRIFLRGDLTVEVVSLVDGVARAESHDGRDVSTWSEFTVHPVAAVRLIARADHGEASLPLHGGVVRAAEASLVWSHLPQDAPAPTPVEIPATASEPGPILDLTEPVEPAELDRGDAIVPSPPAPPIAPDELSGLLAERVDRTSVFSLADAEQTGDLILDPSAGDDDGHTISAAEIARLRAARAGAYDAGVTDESAPPRASLRMPSGEVIGLERPVYIGRSPSARQVGGTALPRLVKIAGEDVDISRTHLEIRFEGHDLVATDLSTNGTIVIRDGAEPQRLQPRTAVLVTDGTVLQLSAITSIVVSVDAEVHDGP